VFGNAEIFVYTGPGGVNVPQNVVSVVVDPSVTSIPDQAFYERTKLAAVELSEGLVEIGENSFACCEHAITKIIIPNSLRRICKFAFTCSLRTPIQLHDDIESIGRGAFAGCIFTNFRIPPLITVIPEFIFQDCNSMFSLELPEYAREINYGTLIEFEFGTLCYCYCHCLRNVAFPFNAKLGDKIFIDEMCYANAIDLQLIFGKSNAKIMSELQHRFDGLPIHNWSTTSHIIRGCFRNSLLQYT